MNFAYFPRQLEVLPQKLPSPPYDTTFQDPASPVYLEAKDTTTIMHNNYDGTSFPGYSLMHFFSSVLEYSNRNPTSSALVPLALNFSMPSKKA